MERLGRTVVRFRVAILVLTFGVVAGAGVMLPRLQIDVSSRNLLFVDESVKRAFNRYLKEWGTDRYLTVAVKWRDGHAFTAPRLRYLRQLTSRLAGLKGIEQADSLTSTTVMSAQGESLFVGPLIPEPVPDDPARLSRLKKRAMDSPILRRMFVDDTGRLVGINLRVAHPGGDERRILETGRRVRQLLDTVVTPSDATLYQMGGPAMLVVMYDLILRDLWVLAVAPILLVGLVLLVVFRSWRGSLLPLLTVIATGTITFGGMAATGHQVNLVTTMLPCLMMVIGVADVIHVLVQHREAVAAGLGRDEAVVTTVRRVGLPCLFTSITTSAGFGSLVLSDVPQVREFGIFAAVGVMVAFVLSVVSVPAALCLLPRPDPDQARRQNEGVLQRILLRLHRLSARRGIPIVIAAVLTAGLGGLGLFRLEVESSTREYLPKDHPLLQQFEVVERSLMGGVPVILHVQDLRPEQAPQTSPQTKPAAAAKPSAFTSADEDEVLDDPEDTPPRGKVVRRTTGREILREPRVLHAIDRLTTRLARLPWVRKVISVTEYLKELNRVMHGGDPRYYQLPRDKRTIAAYFEMAAGRDRQGMEKLVNWEYSRASVTIMCAWPNTRKIRRILQISRDYLRRKDVRRQLGPDVRVEITGIVPLLAHVADRMVDGQLKSFFMALLIICLMMIALFWSFRVGLLAMVPNVLPILLTLGLMGWLGVTLNVTTVMIASIALGIAVDDTIHILVRMRAEARRTGDHDQAILTALQSVGRAVWFTSFVLAGGFTVLLLSSLVPAGHFGVLTAFTMLTALVADLIVTPVLIRWAKPWKKQDPTP